MPKPEPITQTVAALVAYRKARQETERLAAQAASPEGVFLYDRAKADELMAARALVDALTKERILERLEDHDEFYDHYLRPKHGEEGA